MFTILKNHMFFVLIIVLFILNGCQLQEPKKNHGIVFLKNRSEKLIVNKSNKNDVLNIVGQPHTKSVDDVDEWIYMERTLTKGEFHKLGQNVLEKNNILILNFDKFGILIEKELLNKEAVEKIKFSKKTTSNQLSKKSFITKMLSSIKEKMYGSR
tara:strand:- start:32 stop:496 length:465 start_codon:yes stop_codon:yes gene_type:complete